MDAVAVHFKRRHRSHWPIDAPGKSLAAFASGDSVRGERIVRKRSQRPQVFDRCQSVYLALIPLPWLRS